HAEQHASAVARIFDRGFRAVARFYEATLKIVLAHRVETLVVTLGTVAITAILALAVPKGFFPTEDTGLVVGVSEASPDISFEQMRDRQQALAAALVDDPAVASVSSSIGADGTNPAANVGRFTIALRPHDERDSAATVIARLKDKA